MTTVQQPDSDECFIRLLAQHERMLTGYVMTLVSSAQDADDILQETKVLMWRKFHHFTMGTNFAAWARKIAFHQVLSFRKRRKRHDHVQFSEEFYCLLAEQMEAASDQLEQRQQALTHCLERLSPDQRQLLSLRYQEELAVETLAMRLNRTVGAVYRLLSRVRLLLRDCVTRTLNHSIPL